MKAFVSADMEGICGVVAERDTGSDGAAAAAARRHMRADLDAVLEGCRAAGVAEIVVCDAHDDGRNIDAAGLPCDVVLVGGSPAPHSMMQGIDAGFDAALFVGYHARAGTANAVLEHTWDYNVFSAALGDVEVGEFGICALLAGHFGVPALHISGDDKVAAEAAALVPGIVTTVVKRGIMRWSAELCAPDEARARLRADVQRALEAKAKPASLAWNGEPLRLTFTRVQYCDQAAFCPGVERLDGRTLLIPGDTFEDIYRTFLVCLALGESQG